MSPDAAPPEQMLQPGDDPRAQPSGSAAGAPTAKVQDTLAAPRSTLKSAPP